MSKFLGSVASDIYGQANRGNSIHTFIPRSKFQFNVTILYHGLSGGLATYSTLPLAGSKLLRVSDITMPSHTARTATYNQYNKKRIIQTGVDYVPIELSVYDTRDGDFDRWLVDYHDYYYKGVMTPHTRVYDNDINSDKFTTAYSDVGLRLRDDRNFIKEIVITRKSSKYDTSTIRIYNPVISAVTGDQLNYADSNPVQYKISFVYEGYSIEDEDPYPVTESGNPTLANMGDYRFNSAERYWEYAEKVTNSGSPTDNPRMYYNDTFNRGARELQSIAAAPEQFQATVFATDSADQPARIAAQAGEAISETNTTIKKVGQGPGAGFGTKANIGAVTEQSSDWKTKLGDWF